MKNDRNSGETELGAANDTHRRSRGEHHCTNHKSNSKRSPSDGTQFSPTLEHFDHMRLITLGSSTSRIQPTSQATTDFDSEPFGRTEAEKKPDLPILLLLALVRHSKITDGLPLSGEERSCGGHRCNVRV